MSTETVDIVHKLTYKADTTELDAYVKKLKKVIKLQKKLDKLERVSEIRGKMKLLTDYCDKPMSQSGISQLVESGRIKTRHKWS